MAARPKARVCGPSLAGIDVSVPLGSWMSVVSVVCCQVEVSASGRSLVQRSPTKALTPQGLLRHGDGGGGGILPKDKLLLAGEKSVWK